MCTGPKAHDARVSPVLLWVNDPACLRGVAGSIPGLVRWVPDPVLPQLWQRARMQLGFHPWSRNFHTLWGQPKKGRKKKIHGRLASEASFYHFKVSQVRFSEV